MRICESKHYNDKVNAAEVAADRLWKLRYERGEGDGSLEDWEWCLRLVQDSMRPAGGRP